MSYLVEVEDCCGVLPESRNLRRYDDFVPEKIKSLVLVKWELKPHQTSLTLKIIIKRLNQIIS